LNFLDFWNWHVFTDYFLEISQEAEDFRETLLEIFKIRLEKRNKSA